MAIPTKEAVKEFYITSLKFYKRYYNDYTAKSMASIDTQANFGISLLQLTDYLKG